MTLVPAERLSIHWKYSLTVNSAAPSGLTNPSGVPLDGSGKGHVGSNYVTSIIWRNLAGRASKLPTYAWFTGHPSTAEHHPYVTAARQGGGAEAVKVVAAQHVKVVAAQHAKVALHAAAVDHLLVTKAVHLPKKPLARH